MRSPILSAAPVPRMVIEGLRVSLLLIRLDVLCRVLRASRLTAYKLAAAWGSAGVAGQARHWVDRRSWLKCVRLVRHEAKEVPLRVIGCRQHSGRLARLREVAARLELRAHLKGEESGQLFLCNLDH